MDIVDNVNLIQTADDATRKATKGFNSNNRYFERIEADNGGGGSTVAIPSIYTISNGGNINVSSATTSNATFENVRTFTLGVDTDSTVTSGSTKPVTSGAVYTSLSGKQDTLVSGTNIKTVNNQSLLGSGNIDIQGSGGYHPDILTFQWSDHILNDIQWLRADTFSWQDGTVYEAAYEHLTDDITGITPTTETIGSYTITVYVASDGHKIVLEDQAQTVQDIYDETGVAWYFILDTANQRFKLPRTKFGFTGLRDTVGKYVEAGLPNITGEYNQRTVDMQANGAFAQNLTSLGTRNSVDYYNGAYAKMTFNASRSSSIYGNSETVQPPATQMYLYFYVGNYTQEAIEQTAGLNTELFNSKLDIDAGNATSTTVDNLLSLVSSSSKQEIDSWGMPDYDSVISLSVTTYTASLNGWIYCNLQANEAVAFLYINDQECARGGGNRSNNDCHLVPIKKGQTARITKSNGIMTFFPCIGG